MSHKNAVSAGKETLKFKFPKETTSSKPTKTAQKRSFRTWLLLFTICVSACFLTIYFTLMAIANWFDNNKIVFHSVVKVEFHTPITIEKRKQSLISPIVEATQSALAIPELKVQAEEPVKVEVVAVKPDVDRMVRAIRRLESSDGKAKEGLAVYCKKKGLSNEYGYGGMQTMKCFATHQEATDRVTTWVHDHLAKFDNNELKTMCWYNLGLEKESCEYSDKYLSIKDKI